MSSRNLRFTSLDFPRVCIYLSHETLSLLDTLYRVSLIANKKTRKRLNGNDFNYTICKQLPVLKTFYDALPQTNYVSIPDGWFVAVTDVVQSRAAIKDGKFKAVNMAGVAMITAVMNALGHQQMPYVFWRRWFCDCVLT